MKKEEPFLDMEKLQEISDRVDKMPQWKKEGWAILDLVECKKCDREGDRHFVSYKSKYGVVGNICQQCADKEII